MAVLIDFVTCCRDCMAAWQHSTLETRLQFSDYIHFPLPRPDLKSRQRNYLFFFCSLINLLGKLQFQVRELITPIMKAISYLPNDDDYYLFAEVTF